MPKHNATKYEFDDLLAGLMKEVDAGNIWVKENGDLRLFNYSKSCTYDQIWNDFTRMARGLILDVKEKRIVALPLEKFFNWNEEAVGELPTDESFQVHEKMDGSLSILYFYDNTWNIATRGSFTSDQAIFATSLLHQYKINATLSSKMTWLTEVIYPENKIVIDYGQTPFLSLLTAYNNESGEELSSSMLDSVAETAGLHRPEQYDYNEIGDMIEVAKTLPGDKEGFVVKFKNGLRIKIKGAEYCRLHQIISNITPLSVWESMANCDDMEVIRREIPEELIEIFEEYEHKIWYSWHEIAMQIQDLHFHTQKWSDKKLAKWLKTDKAKTFVSPLGGWGRHAQKVAVHYVFAYRRGKFDSKIGEFWHPTYFRYSAMKRVRPTNNKFVNYEYED